MIYTCLRFIAKPFLHFLFRIEITGIEHVPKDGPVIIAANHISAYDPIVLASVIKRKIHFLAKKELFSNRFSHWLFSQLYAIPVDRYSGIVIKPVRHSLRVIRSGNAFAIFPEGTRCKNRQTVQPKKGVAFFAMKTGAPVLPIAFVLAKKGRSRTIKIIIGKPIFLSDYAITNYFTVAQMIMNQIKSLTNEGK
ncbi:lysophospholipid acyltransferase family protein [Aneurinibacillus migulanus]|uniref:lysophospholipid acyltransferase family protein n=1 Tax=Aneurinibacillus migulanus TaxID=47500 RepID=UPI002E20E60C|nr:lysophospholipid acyltransferase family protein [Aneurinibacillus migulanus]